MTKTFNRVGPEINFFNLINGFDKPTANTTFNDER